MNYNSAIRALNRFEVQPLTLVDDQTVNDIISYMPVAHKSYARMYDRLVSLIEEGSIKGVCYEIWDFCRQNLQYNEEGIEDQRLSSPSAMLRRGWSDCKGYALFAGGLMDALNRAGSEIDWFYRFVPSSALGTGIGHVFVVVDPDGENIWIDPVLGVFDRHSFFLVHRDVYAIASPVTIGKVSGLQALYVPPGYRLRKVGSAESSLLSQLDEYTEGMTDAVSLSQGTGVINTISALVILSANAIVPGISLAVAAVQALAGSLSKDFPPGSLSARLLADVSNNILTAPVTMIESILDGRTFESDQYWGATYYYYYVLGQSKYLNNPNQVSDTDVPVALKWFIDRLGVFISGREHIEALVKGSSAYLALYKVNGDTTTSPSQVNAAVAVAQEYFNFNGGAGSWADTIGVYDVALVNIANQMGESVEEAAAQDQSGQLGVPVYASQAASLQSIITDPWIMAAAIALAIIVIL
jgi:hypothetical protein